MTQSNEPTPAEILERRKELIRRFSIVVNLAVLVVLLYFISKRVMRLQDGKSWKLEETVDLYLELGGRVHYEYDAPHNKVKVRSEPPAWDITRPSIKRVVGVFLPNPMGDAPISFDLDPAEFAAKFGESGVEDEDLRPLSGLKDLRVLVVASTKVTDEGIANLTGLESLESLMIIGAPITSRSAKVIANLENLESVILRDTDIGDAGLDELRRLKKLNSIDITGSKVSRAALRRFARALPDCHIYR